MSEYFNSENKLVTCPYDEAHKVKSSRLQVHIAKCEQNHLDKIKKKCPFNASHLLPAGEFDHHLITCPDRAPLDRQLAQSVDKNNPFKGRTDVPQYSAPIDDDEECWDTGTRTVVQLPGPPPGAVVQPKDLAKPSERKSFYSDLSTVQLNAENNKTSSKPAEPLYVPIIEPPSEPVKAPSRQPVTFSQAKMGSTQSNAPMIDNLGLGRGKPASRIAANFPEVESTYSSVVRDFGNLGLGRGVSSKNNKDNTPVFDNDDFPALGCGRGLSRKASRAPGKPK